MMSRGAALAGQTKNSEKSAAAIRAHAKGGNFMARQRASERRSQGGTGAPADDDAQLRRRLAGLRDGFVEVFGEPLFIRLAELGEDLHDDFGEHLVQLRFAVDR